MRFNPATATFTNYVLIANSKGDLLSTTFGNLLIDSDDRVWFGTENGVYVLNQTTQQFEHFSQQNGQLNNNAVASIFEAGKDYIYIATDHGGLNIYNRHTGRFTYLLSNRHEAMSISNNQLYDIYQSRDGIIWIGSFQGGVNYYDPKAFKFQQYKYLLPPDLRDDCCYSVIALGEDAKGNIWIGKDGGGIDIYNPQTGVFQRMTSRANDVNSIRSNVVASLMCDSRQHMWIGYYLSGMSDYNLQTGQFEHYDRDLNGANKLPANNIWAILEDDNDIFWLSTIGQGLCRWDRKSNQFQQFRNDVNNSGSISNNDVFLTFKDSHHNLWVGTRSGLNRMNADGKTFTHYSSDIEKSGGILGKWIFDIFEDRQGNLWVGSDKALNKYNAASDTFISYTEKDGLAGNAFMSIREDRQGNLWIGTNVGLTRLNPNNLSVRNYSMADGLQDKEFNYTTSLVTRSGLMYFGGKNGFNVFNPDSIKDNPLIPNVLLTDFKIFYQSVDIHAPDAVLSKSITFTDTIHLNHKQSTLTFCFAALNFTNTSKNQYKCKLEGFDNDWNYLGAKHEVTYTNLDPGIYTLRILASNNDGLWTNTERTVTIIIEPPFWNTLWFYLIVIFLIAFVVVLYVKLRERRLQSDKRLLLKKVSERTIQIEAQKFELENHRTHLEKLVEKRTHELLEAKERAEEADRLKSAFLANMSHEIRTPLNAILGFSSLIATNSFDVDDVNSMNDIVQDNGRSLLQLINDIIDLSMIEANQLKIYPSTFSLSKHLNSLLLNYQQQLKMLKNDDQLTVLLEMPSTDLMMHTDADRLSQIITNLFGNAIKFTKQGFIKFGYQWHEEADEVCFFVEDTGIGIDQKNLDRIFDRFNKIESDKEVLHRGTGLGLSICTDLIKLLGGNISVISTLGKGTRFSFTLPRRAQQADENLT
jgi:signal transduction histidine kinase/streptogramin lyase